MTEYDISAISCRVADLVLESLDREGEECDLSTRLIDDLDAESLDYLDIVFRIEREYGVKIKRGRIEKSVAARLPGVKMKPNTDATDELKVVLKEYMPEVAPERIDAISKVKEIAALFTVGTFVRTAIVAIVETYPDVKIHGDSHDGYDAFQLGVLPAPPAGLG